MSAAGPALPFRTIWIVGASSGIGRDTALQMAAAGASVVASARSRDELDALAQDCPSGRIVPVSVDVTDKAAVEKAYSEAVAAVGPIEAVLFGAATWAPDSEMQVSSAQVEKVYKVNVFGCLNVLETVLPDMKAAHFGRIAVISSVAGFRGLPRALAYGSSKAALTHMMETLRLQLARDNITVQVIHPGFVRTPLTDKNDFPMPFLMEPDAAAARIVAGMAGNSFEMTFPRRFTWMLKLLRILPYRLYFWLVAKGTKGKA